MFGIFGISKDAKTGANYLLNFLEFVQRSVDLFGFDKALNVIAHSEWAAGTELRNDRSFTNIHFRLSIPLETFYAEVSNEAELSLKPSTEFARVEVYGIEKFTGFTLFHYTETKQTQVIVSDGFEVKATARAMMLVARLKTYGAIDISRIVSGKW